MTDARPVHQRPLRRTARKNEKHCLTIRALAGTQREDVGLKNPDHLFSNGVIALNPLEPLYSFQFVFLLACAVFYYKAAELDKAPGLLWAGLSVLIYLLTWQVFHWGWVGCLAGQVSLLAGITLVRIFRSQA
jgi:hypothetical protein